MERSESGGGGPQQHSIGAQGQESYHGSGPGTCTAATRTTETRRVDQRLPMAAKTR